MSVSKSNSNYQTSDSPSISNYDLDLTYQMSLFNSDSPKKTTECLSPFLKDSITASLCCLCSLPNLLKPCSHKECTNFFHLHCVSFYFPELLARSVCPSHSFKHLADSSKKLYLSNQFNFYSSLGGILKSEKTNKNSNEVLGNFFWFGINQQYFPYFTTEKPEFYIENDLKGGKSSSSSWLSSKITKTNEDLSAVTTSILDLLKSYVPASNNCCKKPKAGENLLNSTKMNLSLQGKFIRNYEKIQMSCLKFTKKDYHHHVSEEKIICAVCDSGEFDDSNLIVICSNCEVAVHSSCYNISKIPETDWLCDVCFASISSSSCALCPVQGGALKLASPDTWAHVTCARYLQVLPKKSFAFDVSKISAEKFKLKCFLCCNKKGACVQCSYGRCATAFHVECCKELLETCIDGEYWLCPSHKASKLTRMVRERKDYLEGFIENIGKIVWKRFFGETSQKVKKVKKKPNEENLKKKIVMEITESCVVMKVVVGKKVIKVVKYNEEKGRKAADSEKRVANDLPLKVRKDETGKHQIMKTGTGEFKIKMNIVDSLLDKCTKRIKN